jgi:chromosome transmission fidelity protein 4
VAVGGDVNCYVSAAMSNGYIRVFTNMGVARMVFSLDGPVVSMTAHNTLLFVVYHSAPPIHDTQCLSFAIYDLSVQALICKDRLPISPVSVLYVSPIMLDVTYLG